MPPRPPFVEHTLVELRCGAPAAGGGCVAHADDGRVVFVRHALPGELVVARITDETTSYLRADAIEVKEPSQDRVTPPCAYAGPGRCGGCDYQHASLPAQRAMKAALVSEQLRRIAGIHLERPLEVEEVPGAPDGLHWRTRVRYGVDRAGHPGFRKHRSRELQLVDACAIAAPPVDAVGAPRLGWTGASAVEVFAPATDADRSRESAPGAWRGRTGDPSAPGWAVVTVAAGHAGLAPRDLPRLAGDGVGVLLDRQVVRNPGRVAARVRHRTFSISAGSFWQVHAGAPDLLSSAVLGALEPRPGEHVLDLFAGVGLFAAFLGEAVGASGRVVAVERDRRACADARRNTSDLACVTVHCGPVTPDLVANLAGTSGAADLVVLDPPREGAGKELCSALAGLDPPPRRIAYVACDPASFARDLATMVGLGWSMTSLRAFDQFPMTEHVELVAVLEPAQGT